MTQRIKLASAGNTLAPALAVLRQLGYEVSRESSSDQLYRAENEWRLLLAEDPLSLLGLVKLLDERGASWRPTDEEVSDFLRLDGDAPSIT